MCVVVCFTSVRGFLQEGVGGVGVSGVCSVVSGEATSFGTSGVRVLGVLSVSFLGASGSFIVFCIFGSSFGKGIS